MLSRGSMLWLAVIAGLMAAPVAQAQQCPLQLGHGWTPATENHGSAVETLLVADAGPSLSLTWLPAAGVESALMLIPAIGGGDWTLRYARPPDRIDDWERSGSVRKRVLRIDQEPEAQQVPMPAAVATRLVASWQRALDASVPADRAAQFHDDSLVSFVVGGQRISGLEPSCGPVELMMDQAEELTETTDEEDADDRVERWEDLQRSLDELDQQLDALATAS